MASGTAAPPEASLPETDPFIPLLILMVRPYQFALVPESALKMALSGGRGESPQATNSGLMGFALSFARASTTFHQSRISDSIFSRHERSSFRSRRGMSARNDWTLSPMRLSSIG